MKRLLNEVRICFTAISENESFARGVAVSFASQASPTVTQLADIKCAVSEAVTNAIVHAYPNGGGKVTMTLRSYEGGQIVITVKDSGVGIDDVEIARQPLYTTDTTGERSGMGFAIMESMTDRLSVRSKRGSGTTVTMRIRVGAYA